MAIQSLEFCEEPFYFRSAGGRTAVFPSPRLQTSTTLPQSNTGFSGMPVRRDR